LYQLTGSSSLKFVQLAGILQGASYLKSCVASTRRYCLVSVGSQRSPMREIMALSTNHPVQLGTTSDVILSTDAAHEGSLSVKECDARSAPTKTRHSYPSR